MTAHGISAVLIGLATAPFIPEGIRAVIAAGYLVLGGLCLVGAALK